MRRRSSIAVLAAVLAFAGCQQGSASPLEEETELKPGARNSPPSASSASSSGGDTKRATLPFRTRDGNIVARAVDVDSKGHAWIDDEGFGWVHDTTPRAAGLSDRDMRWPNGTVNFIFTHDDGDPEGMNAERRDVVRAAMAYIHDRIPQINFVEFDDDDTPPQPFVTISQREPVNGSTTRSRSDVGAGPFLNRRPG